jgi:hypothetical protein
LTFAILNISNSHSLQDRAGDDKHAERATRQLEDAQASMLDAKNTYLIGIAMSNTAKDKFYDESVPAIEDVSTTVVHRISHILILKCSNTVRSHSLHESTIG